MFWHPNHTIRLAICLPLELADELRRQAREKHLDLDTYLFEAIYRLATQPNTPTAISFHEVTMNPTAAGQTQVFTGTLSPVGSAFPTDVKTTITSNDTAVSPSLDSTGLIVSVTYPNGWVESTTTPLAFTYSASSASNPTWNLGATITPSVPPAPPLPLSITFFQTT